MFKLSLVVTALALVIPLAASAEEATLGQIRANEAARAVVESQVELAKAKRKLEEAQKPADQKVDGRASGAAPIAASTTVPVSTALTLGSGSLAPSTKPLGTKKPDIKTFTLHAIYGVESDLQVDATVGGEQAIWRVGGVARAGWLLKAVSDSGAVFEQVQRKDAKAKTLKQVVVTAPLRLVPADAGLTRGLGANSNGPLPIAGPLPTAMPVGVLPSGGLPGGIPPLSTSPAVILPQAPAQ
jgi:hypothetical protein